MRVTIKYETETGVGVEVPIDVPDRNWDENKSQFSANFQRFVKDTEQYLLDGKKLGGVVVQTA